MKHMMFLLRGCSKVGRKDKISEINDSLVSCSKCDRQIKNPRPFYFAEYNINCKVVLITLTPSIQAIYRPLFSTRFFRILCLALFGAYPERRDFVEIFNSGEIFWTHLQKCYTEDLNKSALDKCANYYIEKELTAINPALVIVLGEKTKTFIKKQAYYNQNQSRFEWCFERFPKTGMEDTFLLIRNQLSNYIKGIDVEPIPDNFIPTTGIDIEEKIAKHAAFELEGIKRWINQVYSEGILKEEADYDSMWFNKYVIPYFTSHVLISLACSYFEEHIKMLLYNQGEEKKRFVNKKTNYKKIKVNNTYLCLEELLDKLTEKKKKDYVKVKYQDIWDNITRFKKLRNVIIHDGAFLDEPYKDISDDVYYPKVKSSYNRIECQWPFENQHFWPRKVGN